MCAPTVRQLIAAPPRMEAALVAYAERYPEEAMGIDRVLEFRRQVGEEDRCMDRLQSGSERF